MVKTGKSEVIHNKIAAPQVVIGIFMGFDEEERPLVVFADNPKCDGIPAYFSCPIHEVSIGSRVALLFISGDKARPIIIGPLKDTIQEVKPTPISEKSPIELCIDDKEHLVITGKQNVTLKCGEASLTLTADGKILLRGKYISSRASGMQTIKGGSVQIN